MTILGSKIDSSTPVAAGAAPVERDAAPPATARVEPVAPKQAVRQDSRRPQEDIHQIRAAIAARLDEFLRESSRNLEFRVDESAHATVITVRRADTGEVVRQYPTEEALSLLRRLNEHSGTFLDLIA